MNIRWRHVWLFALICLLHGCDGVTAHKIATTIFDGVPSLPSQEEYCGAYQLQQQSEEQTGLVNMETLKVDEHSSHPPYKEKKCDSCHDKTKQSGLILPPEKLCFKCHPDINQGPSVHGPVAVGACLACHGPHSSSYPALLNEQKEQLCAYCHKEKRLAENMHSSVTDRGLLCLDCHSPHSGNGNFFLR